ncbi:ribosomal protein L7/L12 [Clostridium sp. UBA4548]|uniref:ribosomal protein L7/L12 n=1 Tax=Clostridium sp. UBA4548 TaxID=1946361 RepID=UPI0025C61CCE|nr:ribosomal protein L7/L12 [Clostridium sp. UBA4548]
MDEKYLVIIIGVAFITILTSMVSELKSDINRMNQTLEKIAKQVGVTGTVIQNIDEELINLILQGKKIKAIKRYRMVTGIGLKEAKDYVDSLDAQQFKK